METQEGSTWHYHVPYFGAKGPYLFSALLHLLNLEDRPAHITISGVDAEGSPGDGEVILTIQANRSFNLIPIMLEQGSSNLFGRFGDGTGHWRLSIFSDARLQVLSLLKSKSGRVSNVSSGRKANSIPPPPSGRYGAYSFDLLNGTCDTVAWEIVIDRRSTEAALNAARQGCVLNGGVSSECIVQSKAFPQCAALSFGEVRRRCGVYLRIGSTSSAAEAAARARCITRLGQTADCHIVTKKGRRASACTPNVLGRDIAATDTFETEVAEDEGLRLP